MASFNPFDPPKFVVGVDPGSTGALAIISLIPGLNEPPQFADFATPYNQDDSKRYDQALSLLYSLPPKNTLAVVELVNSRPGEGHVGAFTFGYHYGFIVAALRTLSIQTHHTPPSVWKRLLGLPGGASNKSKSIDLALALFPKDESLKQNLSRKKDHNRAEALLLAHFGVKHLLGCTLQASSSTLTKKPA